MLGLKRALELRRSYKAVFGTPDGQKVLHDLMAKHLLITPAAITSDATLINVGMQKVVQDICHKVFSSDEQFIKALEEARQEQQQNQYER